VARVSRSVRRAPLSRLLLVAIGLFYLLPMLSMARFAFQRVPMYLLDRDTLLTKWTFMPLVDAVRRPEFATAALLSVRLAAIAAVLTLVLLLPTLVYAHVSLPAARPVLDTIAVLPFVVPAIALVVGISGAFRPIAPWFISSDLSLVPFYVVIALPYTYRSIDNALSALDLRTLVDASRSLGAGWPRIVWQVVIPNVRGGLATAALLVATVVLGEFTVASLLLKETLPLYLAYSQGADPQGTFAIGLALMVVTAGLLGAINRASARRGGATVTGVM
jgi:putative spermidine/putrescine transport system permease protein